MPQVDHAVEPLVAGQRLSREEFLKRWDQLPHLKYAELIGGIVYMPSPLSIPHGDFSQTVSLWLGTYAVATPGCKAGASSTWLMLEDAPQPDIALRILAERGGAHRIAGRFAEGVPELIVEISVSTKSYDLGAKLELYRKAGVPEYISVLVKEKRVIWRRLSEGAYLGITPDADGIMRSHVFPGLWLDPVALLADDGPRLLEVVNQGLASAEHQAFVDVLAQRKPKQ